MAGDFSILRTNLDSPYGLTNLLGSQTGQASFSILSNTFVRGNCRQPDVVWGGVYENDGQTNLLAFLNAGAGGSYGTVIEPCNSVQKFPSPQDHSIRRVVSAWWNVII